MSSLRLAIVFASLCTAVSTSVQAAVYRTLWGTDSWSVQDIRPWLLTDNSIQVPATIKGTPCGAWRSSSQHYRGTGAACGIQLNPTGAGDIRNIPADKLNYGICQLRQTYSLRIGQEKAVGFAIKLASDFMPAMQTPTLSTSVVITQFWQGLRPPVSVNLINDGHGNLKWQVWVFNEQTGGGNESMPIVINTTAIAKGVWVTFVVDVKLNPNGSGGLVKVWFNDSLVVNWTGKVGYNKGFTNSGGGVAGDNCSCDIGLYRNHGQPNTMQAFFDVAKYGDSYSDVAP